jgi:hypothetical protein
LADKFLVLPLKRFKLRGECGFVHGQISCAWDAKIVRYSTRKAQNKMSSKHATDIPLCAREI